VHPHRHGGERRAREALEAERVVVTIAGINQQSVLEKIRLLGEAEAARLDGVGRASSFVTKWAGSRAMNSEVIGANGFIRP